MTLTDGVITTLISVLSAVATVMLKDILLATLSQRRSDQRTLLLTRVEQAYSPLEYLVFRLLNTDVPEQKEAAIEEICTILRNHGHLLSAQTAAAFYTLIGDEQTGALLLKDHFYDELTQLKEDYYRKWYSRRPTLTTNDSELRRSASRRIARDGHSRLSGDWT
jgi:hypothetical protein